jgi:hypothetical protein
MTLESATIFSGYENGKSFRESYGLSKLDEDEQSYKFVVPDFVVAVTSSFFRGAFYDSIEALGTDHFEEKYKFEGPNSLHVVKDALVRSFDSENGT